jgi:hypothetical protein
MNMVSSLHILLSCQCHVLNIYDLFDVQVLEASITYFSMVNTSLNYLFYFIYD